MNSGSWHTNLQPGLTLRRWICLLVELYGLSRYKQHLRKTIATTLNKYLKPQDCNKWKLADSRNWSAWNSVTCQFRPPDDISCGTQGLVWTSLASLTTLWIMGFVGRYFESWPQRNMIAFKTFQAKSFRLRKQEQAASLLGISGSVSS